MYLIHTYYDIRDAHDLQYSLWKPWMEIINHYLDGWTLVDETIKWSSSMFCKPFHNKLFPCVYVNAVLNEVVII